MSTPESTSSQESSSKQTKTSAPPPLIDTSDLTSGLMGPLSPRSAAEAARAMSSTEAWKPSLERRQSFANQDYKHELQSRQLQTNQEASATADASGTTTGFSETTPTSEGNSSLEAKPSST